MKLDAELHLPANLDAERLILGAILGDPEATVLLPLLTPEYFTTERHRRVLEALMRICEGGMACDRVTLISDLRDRGHLEACGGIAGILDLDEDQPKILNLESYVSILREKAALRRIVRASHYATIQAGGEAITAKEVLDTLAKDLEIPGQDSAAHAMLSAGQIIDRAGGMDAFFAPGRTGRGIDTPWKRLNEITAGLHPGELIVLAGNTGSGKSSAAMQIGQHAAEHGHTVQVFSLEMSRENLVERMVCQLARVDGQRFRGGYTTAEERGHIRGAAHKIADWPLRIAEHGCSTVAAIQAAVQRERGAVQMVVIDYLQLMRAVGNYGNRHAELSEITRRLKLLAREHNLVVVLLSQLSRDNAKEKRAPLLSDLRESGCLAGESMVMTATGELMSLAELASKREIGHVNSLDGWKETLALGYNARSVGIQPVLRVTTASGRTLIATGNHKLRTLEGWQRLDTLAVGDHIAALRKCSSVGNTEWPQSHIILLAHLLGDGCFASRQPLKYTSASECNLRAVEAAAFDGFGVQGWRLPQGSRTHLQLSAKANKWHPNPIRLWLRELGIDGKRAHEKTIPRGIFTLPDHQVALFLRHLWATDGCVWVGRSTVAIYYSTSSLAMAGQVQHLLVRLGIWSTVRSTTKVGYRPNFHVCVQGKTDQSRFSATVGAFGEKMDILAKANVLLDSVRANTNLDVVPSSIWIAVRKQMMERGISQRRMAGLRGTSYGGTSHYRFSPSRSLLASYAAVLQSAVLGELATSDVRWDRIVSIEAAGRKEVFDLSVAGTHNFVANGLVVHNSIEENADVVLFVWRPEMVHRDREDLRGLADLIVAKQRNGPTGRLQMAWLGHLTKFEERAEYQ